MRKVRDAEEWSGLEEVDVDYPAIGYHYRLTYGISLEGISATAPTIICEQQQVSRRKFESVFLGFREILDLYFILATGSLDDMLRLMNTWQFYSLNRDHSVGLNKLVVQSRRDERHLPRVVSMLYCPVQSSAQRYGDQRETNKNLRILTRNPNCRSKGRIDHPLSP